jgi:uncharacterized membrane protein
MNPHAQTVVYIILCSLGVGLYIAREQHLFELITEITRKLP